MPTRWPQLGLSDACWISHPDASTERRGRIWATWIDSAIGTTTHARTEFNEIYSITVGGGSPIVPVYDKNGNLRQGEGMKLEWDAFGRLHTVRRASNDDLLARYLYDADNRRVRRTVTNGGLPADSGLNGSWDYAYLGWRVVEERDVAVSEEPLRQYVWGEYLDELWTVDRGFVATVAYFNDGSGAERLFALGTVMHHVAGLTDEEARLIEAFEYTPYGRPTRIAPNPESDEVAFHPSDIRTPGAPPPQSSRKNLSAVTGGTGGCLGVPKGVKKGDPIVTEASPNGVCRMTCVDPKQKEKCCQAPKIPHDYAWYGYNCHDWAQDCTREM
ncbi:MAG: hypothetical protein KF858_00585 [Candidatus Sumerlaeia bacterium]|nr:hypothetical protein [Candidatus Sumerlaeia bacterium]